jgi:alpha-amylase
MVRFRGAVKDAPVTKWWDNGMNQIAFARGDQGFVVINRQDIALEQSFDTGLAMGRYCDVLSTAPPGECGALIDVDAEGRATLAVSPLSAVALLKGIP